MPAPPPPFACAYSPQLPELIHRLGCSLALTTYQAGKLIFLSATDEEKVIQLPRTFDKPMGLGYDADSGRLAVACRDEVITLANSPELATHYPKSPGRYDALFAPRVTYHTGRVDIHDLRFGASPTGGDGLYAVNTRFDCVVRLDDRHNFVPHWRPPHLTRLAPDDRCHVNGMAMEAGRPRYVSAFGTGDAPGAWRDTLLESGVIYDLEAGEILSEGLPMPHSPRLFGDDLYVLLSATGQLARIDRDSGAVTVVCELGGFVRGMDLVGEHLFVGLSKLRRNSSTFAKLPFAERADRAGLVVVHLPTGARVAELTYRASVDELYDVLVLPGMRRPNALNTAGEAHKHALATPQTTFWARSPAEQ